jgi:tetratricopeptide (TPR) repeat protein
VADRETLERIDDLRAIGRSSEAEALLRTALLEEPQDSQLLWRLAAVLLVAKRPAEGVAAAAAAVAADPENPNAHRLHGLLLAELGYLPQALHAAYTAVTQAPEHAHTSVAYSYVLGCARRYPDAAAVARRAVELAPHDTEPHAQVGDIALMSGDRATARRAYSEVLRLDPAHAGARRNLAALDHVGHRPREALRGLVEAGRMDPDVPEVLTLVTAVMWQLSWRMRIGLVVALIPLLIISTTSDSAPWPTRIVGVAIIVLAGVAAWWHLRELPHGTHTVVFAAIRRDGLLVVTYVFIAICLLAYVVVAITGYAPAAAIIWPLAILLAVIAVLSRMLTAARRSGSGRH